MGRLQKHWVPAVFVIALIALFFNAHAQDQPGFPEPLPASAIQPVTPGNPAQSDASKDLVAQQVDELLKQCNEQMNVKGQFRRVGELAQQALDLSRQLGDTYRIASAMGWMSAAYAYQGRLAEAADISQSTVVLARETGDKKLLEQSLNTAAGVAGELGRYEESLRYLYECLEIARDIGDMTMQYMALLNIGEAYNRLGDSEKAEAPLQSSLQIARQLKNNSKKATELALLNLGETEVAHGHYQAALKDFEQVRNSHPDSPLWAIEALGDIAGVYEQLGQPQKAIELLKEALPLAEKASSGGQYARLLSHVGGNQAALGKFDEALASHTHALDLFRQSGGSPSDEWLVASFIARDLRAMGRKQDALEHYQESVRGIERLRSAALNTEAGRAGILAESRATYAETADLLYDLHREQEALEMAEKGRARAFLDILAESRLGVINELTPEQRKREEAILARVASAEKDLWKDNVAARDKKKHEDELTSAEDTLDAFQLEVRHSNPRFASLQYPEPIGLNDIRNRLLDEHTALVEYLLGEKRSLVWVVTRGHLTSAVLPGRKEIEDQVNAYRKLLTERVSILTLHQSLLRISHSGTRLYGLIFQPIANAVASSRRLIVVPDGNLAYLPFEALVFRSGSAPQSRPEYLTEKFTIVYGPSASALATVQALNHKTVAPTQILLAFGDPVLSDSPASAGRVPSNELSAYGSKHGLPVPETYAERGFSLARLPYTRDEIMSIRKLFPASLSHIYLGSEARKELLKGENLSEFRFIHFASHGFLDEVKPGRSGILFSSAHDQSEVSILRMDEIMRLNLNSDLVTLSACSTGLGKLVNGEGMLGLTRALFYAGARNVAVSLWNVNDSATAKLMESFYRNLNGNLPEGEAMRKAKLSLLHATNAVWQHPYFWSAFIVEGEGH